MGTSFNGDHLICGDRHWSNWAAIEYEIFCRLDEDDIVIHGGCKGADLIAGRTAQEYGLIVIVFHAEWDKYGRAAGPKRNQQMLDEGQPDEVWAFHPDITKSKGTKDMVNRARRAGVPVRIFTGEP